jgi:hypothetical protein
MKKMMVILIAVLLVMSGCGANADSTPEVVKAPLFPSMKVSADKASYLLEDGQLASAKAFYDQEMASDGWKTTGDTEGKNGEVRWTKTKWTKSGATLIIQYLDHPDQSSNDYILFEDKYGKVVEVGG